MSSIRHHAANTNQLLTDYSFITRLLALSLALFRQKRTINSGENALRLRSLCATSICIRRSALSLCSSRLHLRRLAAFSLRSVRVAFKVIKLGMDTTLLITPFRCRTAIDDQPTTRNVLNAGAIEAGASPNKFIGTSQLFAFSHLDFLRSFWLLISH
jgi:hypothetical protein